MASWLTKRSDEEQAFQRLIQEMQVRESLMMYNTFVEKCFDACVSDIVTSEVDSSESKCIKGCAEKYMLHSKRVTQRFGEFQMAQQQKMGRK